MYSSLTKKTRSAFTYGWMAFLTTRNTFFPPQINRLITQSKRFSVKISTRPDWKSDICSLALPGEVVGEDCQRPPGTFWSPRCHVKSLCFLVTPPCSPPSQVPLSASMSPVRLHSSNPNLCAELVDFQPPVSRLTDSVECASDYIKLQEEFCTIAQKGQWDVTMIIIDFIVLHLADNSYKVKNNP